jgi:hypothetical protein
MKTTTQQLTSVSFACLRWLRQMPRAAQFAALILMATAGAVFAQSENQTAGETKAADNKPNILVIMGDDIGWYNPSIYHRGDMGYWTPNIDRIGKEGAMFTCGTASRVAQRDAPRSSPGSRRFAPG